MRERAWKIATALGVLLVIGGLPIWVYIHTFGSAISTNHTRWAEMGAAMAGIYSPILSVMTVALLYFQFQLLRTQNRLQSEMAEFTVTESVARTRQELLSEYLKRLEEYFPPRLGTNERLLTSGLISFFGKNKETLDQLYPEAIHLHISQPRILDTWIGVYVALSDLKNHDHPKIRSIHEIMVLKVITTLSTPVAQALDNYHYSAGLLGIEAYQFGSLRNKSGSNTRGMP